MDSASDGNSGRSHRAQDLLTCILCSKYFEDPRLLPCGHTFCRRCLERYHSLQSQPSEGRFRSTSTDRHRRSLLPCPAAPVCLHVAVIPEQGISGFPVDARIARIKERVVNEMADDISRRFHIGAGSSDTASTKSDQSDLTDVSYDSYYSAPSVNGEERASRTDRRNPDIDKYAKYFDQSETDASTYTPRTRSDRRRVGYSSSFQHRRRHVNVASPTAFDDTTRDFLRRQPSRSGSAPHLDADPLQRTTSPLLRKARPTSLILEEILLNDNDAKARDTKACDAESIGRPSRRAFSSDRQEHRVPFREAGTLPTHRENLATDEKKPFRARHLRVEEILLNDSDVKTRDTKIHDPEPVDRSSRRAFSSEQQERRIPFRDAGTLPTHRENLATEEMKARASSHIFSTPVTSKHENDNLRASSEHHPAANKQTGQQYDETSNTRSSRRKLPDLPDNPRFTASYKEKEQPVPAAPHRQTTVKSEQSSQDKDRLNTGDKGEHKSGLNVKHSETKKCEFIVRDSPIDVDRARSSQCGNVKSELKETGHIPKTQPAKTDNTSDKMNKLNDMQNISSTEPRISPKNGSGENGSIPSQPSPAQSKIFHAENIQTNASNDNRTPSHTPSKMCDPQSPVDGTKPEPVDGSATPGTGPKNSHTPNTSQKTFTDKPHNDATKPFSMPKWNKTAANKTPSAKSPNISAQTRPSMGNNKSNPSPSSSDPNLHNKTPSSDPRSSKTKSKTENVKRPEQNSQATKQNGHEQVEETVDANDDDIDDDHFYNIIKAARLKYSNVADTTKSEPTSQKLSIPVCADNVRQRWRVERDDFAIPSSIAIDSSGVAVVADAGNSLLDYVDEDGNVTHSVTGMKPFSVAIASSDRIYVGDRRSKTVRVFDIFGCDVAQWDSETTSFGWIAGIAVLRNGNLVIIDRERCKIGVYTPSGERVTEFGAYGVGESQLCMADFVATDSHDRVVIADSGNHYLKVFDSASGKFVARYSGRGNGDGCLLWPKGVTIDQADNIIVTDTNNDRVTQFANDGRFIAHLITNTPRPYHVTCNANNLLGVTHFGLSGSSQIDVYAIDASS